MKILQISSPDIAIRDDMTYGGTQRVIRSLQRRYKELGYEADVAAPGDSGVHNLRSTIPVSIWTSLERGERLAEATPEFATLAHYMRL